MVAFISYSVSDDDYADIVAPLAWKLDDQGFYPSTAGYFKVEGSLMEEAMFKIKAAHLFIGILATTKIKASTAEALQQRVINEWEYAVSRKIPSLLLLDKSIKLSKPLSNSENIIPFDRNDPKKAISFVEKALFEAQRPIKEDKTNVAAWIFGSDSILKLISLLSKTVKKEKLVAA